MGTLFLSILADLISGTATQRMDAVEAFEARPLNPTASRYRITAICFFLATSSLFLTAALVHICADARVLGEILGWTGIACVHVCIVCGLRYRIVNRRPDFALRNLPCIRIPRPHL